MNKQEVYNNNVLDMKLLFFFYHKRKIHITFQTLKIKLDAFSEYSQIPLDQ